MRESDTKNFLNRNPKKEEDSFRFIPYQIAILSQKFNSNFLYHMNHSKAIFFSCQILTRKVSTVRLDTKKNKVKWMDENTPQKNFFFVCWQFSFLYELKQFFLSQSIACKHFYVFVWTDLPIYQNCFRRLKLSILA